MKASLIIYIKSDVVTLPLLFSALKQQTEKDFEVIFAQDGCDKKIGNLINELKEEVPFQVKHLSYNQDCYKREALLNRAIVESESDYLIFMEEGTIPHHKFVADHLRLSRYGRVVAARKITLTKDLSSEITEQLISSRKIQSYLQKRLLSQAIKGKAKNISEVFRLTNGFLRHFILNDVWQGLSSDNFSIYKEDIVSVNGFDERFDVKSEESDFDLELRLMQQGVFTKEERRIATLYNVGKEQTLLTSPIASAILTESSDKNLSWTPFGIKKEESPKNEEE